MDYYQVPIGFGMALARNPQALNAYSAMTDEQKQAILNQARNARSEQEMNRIVTGLVRGKDRGFAPVFFPRNVVQSRYQHTERYHAPIF